MTRGEIIAGARDAIQNGSKSFRAASRLFDRETRQKAWLLYCWCRDCDDVCDGQTYGFAGGVRGKVAALRGKTDRVIQGDDEQELPFQALRLLLSECHIPIHLLDDHLSGFALDEAGWRPATEEDLALYCYYVAGAVGCMMAIVMGVPEDDQETLERAADLGIAFQLSNIVRDIREDLEAGRCYLPAEWLREFGATPETLFDPSNEKALSVIVKRLIDSVEIYETSARRGADKLPFRSRLAVLSALRIYGAIGRRVGRLGSAAWDERVTVGKIQKLAYLVPSFAEAVLAGR